MIDDDDMQHANEPDLVDGDWRETVRVIFDELHFGEQSVFNNELARKVVTIIEERHHDFFCVGKTMEEWKDEK